MENVVAILEVLVLHDVEQVSRLTADGSYRGFMIRREPRCQSSTLGIEAGVRTRGNTADACDGAQYVSRSTPVGGKSIERIPNHLNIERIRYFTLYSQF